jgi:hypothetical protein
MRWLVKTQIGVLVTAPVGLVAVRHHRVGGSGCRGIHRSPEVVAPNIPLPKTVRRLSSCRRTLTSVHSQNNSATGPSRATTACVNAMWSIGDSGVYSTTTVCSDDRHNRGVVDRGDGDRVENVGERDRGKDGVSRQVRDKRVFEQQDRTLGQARTSGLAPVLPMSMRPSILTASRIQTIGSSSISDHLRPAISDCHPSVWLEPGQL